MATVQWTPILPQLRDNPSAEWVNILIQEPKPAIQYIAQRREDSKYLRCPAFVDSMKNVFVLESPVDVSLSISHTPFSVVTENQNQYFFDEFVGLYPDRAGPNDPMMLTLPPHVLFYSDASVKVELLPTMLVHEPRLSSMRVVPGVFDISKWFRPVECTFELDKSVTRLDIKAGDPLVFVRFTPDDGSVIKFERVMYNQQLRSAIAACVTVKNVCPHKKLSELYKLAKSYILKFTQ